MDMTDKPFDYLVAIAKLQKDKKADRHQVKAPDSFPARTYDAVDYLAASKAWELEQAEKHINHLRTTKRNTHHDPELQTNHH